MASKKPTERVKMLQHWIKKNSKVKTYTEGLTDERQSVKASGTFYLFVGIVSTILLVPLLTGWIEIEGFILHTVVGVISAVFLALGIALRAAVKDIDYMLEAEAEIESLQKRLGNEDSTTDKAGEVTNG